MHSLFDTYMRNVWGMSFSHMRSTNAIGASTLFAFLIQTATDLYIRPEMQMSIPFLMSTLSVTYEFYPVDNLLSFVVV